MCLFVERVSALVRLVTTTIVVEGESSPLTFFQSSAKIDWTISLVIKENFLFTEGCRLIYDLSFQRSVVGDVSPLHSPLVVLLL